jgi:hypothetical protein
MTVMPAQVDQSVTENVKEFVEVNRFFWQARIQVLSYLARTGVRIDGAISNRAEIFSHEFGGRVCP